MMWLIANRQLVAKFTFAAVVLFCMWLCYSAGQRKIQEQWDKEKAIQTVKIITGNAVSSLAQLGLSLKFADALEDFERDKIITQNEIDNLVGTNQRLQDRINANQNRVPNTATPDSGNAGATSPSWGLFAECASEVTWLGAEADRLRDRAELGRRYAEIASESITATEMLNKGQ